MEALIAAPSPTFLKMLAHDLRWRTLVALTYSDRRVQELVSLLHEPSNLVSYHLKRLRDTGLVRERRSSADARDVYYSIDMQRVHDLYFAAGETLHPSLSETATTEQPTTGEQETEASGPIARVLFLCTHNAARSQLAEGIMRHLSKGRVEAFSAGSEPSEMHPTAARLLEAMGADISSQRSKHLNEYIDQDFDYIVTVCDRAKESCPIFPGDPEQIHWSFADPTAIEDEEEQLRMFRLTAHEMTTRVRFLLNLIENKHRRKGTHGQA